MAALRPALVVIGFMGAGKSRTARRAREAGLDALDTDELLERELGMPIADFFERHGEAEFRAREEALVAEALDGADGGAIALGGGSVTSAGVRAALERHFVAWLDVDVERAWRRVAGKSKRPLARDRASFEALHDERLSLYREVADARLLWADSASGSYPVFVGHGILGRVPWPVQGRRFLVTDREVGPRYGARLEPLAGAVQVEPGEAAKTMAEAERVLRELAGLGMTRADHVVALGGGVVGDLAGFCAAVYQRGVQIVQAPTTLVAQVDSAYGGKTGVDLPEAKNYAGVYHQPAAVVADTETLATLPEAEVAAGFAEVVKTALLAGGELWEQVRSMEQLDLAAADELVFACARFKTDVVAADERDAGPRQTLNLGHTVGHAIEAAGDYRRYRHGEAVALGLLAALRLSAADGLRDEVRAVLVRLGLPVELDPGVDVEAVLAALERDKKRDAEGVRFVLLERPGEPRIGERISADRVRAAVEELVATR